MRNTMWSSAPKKCSVLAFCSAVGLGGGGRQTHELLHRFFDHFEVWSTLPHLLRSFEP